MIVTYGAMMIIHGFPNLWSNDSWDLMIHYFLWECSFRLLGRVGWFGVDFADNSLLHRRTFLNSLNLTLKNDFLEIWDWKIKLCLAVVSYSFINYMDIGYHHETRFSLGTSCHTAAVFSSWSTSKQGKGCWTWKRPMFNWKCIFKCWSFHCNVSFRVASYFRVVWINLVSSSDLI